MSGLDIFSLTGKRALVTGAGRGIGRALAKALAAAGAEVVVCARTQSDLDEVAGEITADGGKVQILKCDITDVEKFETEITRLPDIHVFINNAGTNRPKPITEVTPEDYDVVVGLNLRATYFAARAAALHMRDRKIAGSIINMSSQMGHVGAANRSLYCASKWAIEGLTKALAVELGPFGIRVNTICPTFIETPMTAPFFADEAFKKDTLNKIKLGRLGKVEDVLGAALLLSSDASSLMTGSAVMIDGGWTAD